MKNFTLKVKPYLMGFTGLLLTFFYCNKTFAQCETINGTYPATTAWQQTNTGGTANNSYIYDDGTNIRLANKTGNTRVGDNTYPSYDVVVKSGENTNLNTQLPTISVVYKTGNNTQNYDRWAIGWSFNAVFPGAGYNQVNPGTTNYNTFWLANVYGQGTGLYLDDASSASGIVIPNYTLTPGDSIMASLVAQPDGTAALHVVATRIVGGVSEKVLDYYDFKAVTAANMVYNATHPIYPALNIITGAVNLGRLKTSLTSYTAVAPATAACESIGGTYPTTSDWQQTNTGGTANNSYIYDDGTNIRLANKTGNTRLGDNAFPNYDVIVKSGEPTNLANVASSITVTYKQGNITQNYDRWAIGWSFNPAFPGAGYNQVSPGSTNYNTFWLANVYGQNNGLYVCDANGTPLIAGYTLTYGDVITASLISQPDGRGALHIVATRVVSGINTTVLNYYDFNAVTAANMTYNISNPVYPALEIITGAVNLGCLSAQSTSGMPLPIDLTIFSATPSNNNSVALSWETATETSNAYFTVEKSSNGTSDWVSVATIPSQGSKGGNYTATDAHPYNGNTYYRLKQTDVNNHFSYSPIVSVSIVTPSEVSVFPNPTSGGVTVTANVSGTLNIYDALGKLVKSVTVQKGANKVSLGKLSAGIYFGVMGNAKIQIIKK